MRLRFFCLLFLLCSNVSYAAYSPVLADCIFNNAQEYGQIEVCLSLLRPNSEVYEQFVVLAKKLDKGYKYDSLIKTYHTALLVFPGDRYFVKKYSIAKSNLEEQKWRHNKKKKSSSGSAAPSSVDFKLNKLRCTRLAGKIALKSCDKAIRLNNKDPVLFIAKGDIYLSQKNNRQAILFYKKALKLNPKDHTTANKLKRLSGNQ